MVTRHLGAKAISRTVWESSAEGVVEPLACVNPDWLTQILVRAAASPALDKGLDIGDDFLAHGFARFHRA